MDFLIDWIAARAILFGGIACLVYVIIPPRKLKKGARHDWAE